jgi:hypothetical protein
MQINPSASHSAWQFFRILGQVLNTIMMADRVTVQPL